MRAAILSSSFESSAQMLLHFLKNNKIAMGRTMHSLRQLAFIVGARGKTNETSEVIKQLSASPMISQQKIMMALADGFKRGGKGTFKFTGFDATTQSMFNSIFAEAEKTARNSQAKIPERVRTIQLLAFADWANVRTPLIALLDSRQPQEVQMASVKTLASFANKDVAEILVSVWRSFTPAVRNEATEALFARKERLNPLMDAIEAGQISASQIPSTKRAVLLTHGDASLRARAEKIFDSNSSNNRKDVVEKYRSALSQVGDKSRGGKVFEANCASCHRFGNLGNDVGPNLATIRGWGSGEDFVEYPRSKPRGRPKLCRLLHRFEKRRECQRNHRERDCHEHHVETRWRFE